MIHRFNGHARLRCDECFKSDEFATAEVAQSWADRNNWVAIEKGGGEIRPFVDHICDLCAAKTKWARAA